ncbi:peptidase C39 [Paraburkholderia sp. CNPSo 3272]|uniref:peptidase C39 n=1 Tax=Paraburkholderia sp. CNPSo 3272 TaxID=2940931 RepID=UPI0020B6561B|nr:peptidase C39 [Paraburkholderia sp. CNPSo 3272]MCP3723859.1 peptidase C39 [Paraburkholderia sp. CNPSo 3272]
MKRNLSQCGIAAAVCALACAFSSGALAAEGIGLPQPMPAFLSNADAQAQGIRCEAVGDDVLAHQTGKYAGSDMISGFVLNLLSQWQLPNGATAVAQGALAVAQNAANQVSAQVKTYATVVDPTHGGTTGAHSGANPNATATGGQNVSINGVSQITQVAGNGNTGANAATISYDNNAPQLANLSGAANQSSASASNAAGSIKAGISFGSNGVNVTLQTPAGIATQNIVPGNMQQAGAIAQLLQVAGNNQQVANQLQLSLQTQQMTSQMIRQTGVLQALRNLH